ncbi:MAG: D-alanyl-D-alanine carboxypeptidase family protein [Blastocatellia bacterium]
MGSVKIKNVGVLILLACAVIIAGSRSIAKSRAQDKPEKRAGTESPRPSTQSAMVRLSAPAKVTAEAVNSAPPAAFELAGHKNEELQTSCLWNFGGKAQRGWRLYVPLIANLIETDRDVAASDFAMRLSLWQKGKGIEPSGVLEAETWSQMVSAFQSRRMSGRPEPSDLTTIPVSDCYDPGRPEELRKADAQTFLAYKRMVAAAAADLTLGLEVTKDGQLAWNEKLFKIVSAYRSREYQDHLRRQSPTSGRAGLAVNSPHATGRALDLYVGGEPVSTKDDNRALQTQGAVYRWLVKNAARFGFQPYFYEPWHWEFVGVQNHPGTGTR